MKTELGTILAVIADLYLDMSKKDDDYTVLDALIHIVESRGLVVVTRAWFDIQVRRQ